MPPLAAIERFFERLFERPSARLFRVRLQPVQVQRRIERAMEAERLAANDRTLVPNRFAVHLHPDDLSGFGDMTGSLSTELADGALRFARSRGYSVIDRPRVAFVPDPAVARSEIQVQARFADPLPGPLEAASAMDVPDSADSLDTGGPMDTAVFAISRPVAATAGLRVATLDGHVALHRFDGTSLTIGRASDNDVVLADGRVSRHHARLTARQGTLVYSDLGSTNGSRVNGVAVGEVVLGPGDRIELGDTVVSIEPMAAG